ncbi:MAG TPA: DUF5610 domain-containing protein [Marinagarivorans sp.]
MNIITHQNSLVTRQLSGNPPAQKCNDGQGCPAKDKQGAASQPSIRVSLSQASIQASRTEAAAPVAPVSAEKTANNPFANNILNAINGQLALDVADGASRSDLQSRLEAGLSGFLSGFDEAFEQLSALAEFSPSIRADVLATKTQVLDGLAETAEQLGLDPSAIQQAQATLNDQVAKNASSEAPETKTLKSANFIPAGAMSAMQASKNSFSFELQTADGDKIEILVSALKASEIKADGETLTGQFAQKNQFELSIEGELDSDELKAINDLLNQVNSVSESFFSGNVEQAFEQALNMGFDSEEIQSFALKLTQSSFSQVQNAYTPEVGRSAGDASSTAASPSKNLVHLGNFMQELEKANVLAERMGQELSTVTELADNISKAKGLGEGGITEFVARLNSRN